MSFPPSKKPPQLLSASLLGACLAVITSVPAAAFLAAACADTYQVRALVYLGLLLWAVVGAIAIFCVTRHAADKPFTLRHCVIWFVSAWLWPVLIATWLMQRKRQVKE